ncbi:MAG: hypothetical protein AB8H79_17160, partial [Myxococcota bacterium]
MTSEPSTQDLIDLLFALQQQLPAVEGLGLDGRGRIAVRAQRGQPIPLPDRALGVPVVPQHAPEPPSIAGWTLPEPIRIGGAHRPAGTLGAVVWRGSQPLVLSNAHVIVPPQALVQPSNSQSCWGAEAAVGTPVAPGRAFVARGRVDRFMPLVSGPRGVNVADAAVASWHTHLPQHECQGATEGVHGLLVAKRGIGDPRLRGGPVVLRRAVWIVKTGDYGLRGQGSEFVFAEQLVVNLRQSGGDSGAVLRDERGAAVGLLHARIGATLALATPASHIEALLDVRFVERGRCAPPL